MRHHLCAVSLLLAVAFATSATAQQREPAVSLESLRAALQKSPQSPILIPAFPWVAPNPRRLGMLTVVPPDTNGEIVKVMVPVGELFTRAARGISNARRRGAVPLTVPTSHRAAPRADR